MFVIKVQSRISFVLASLIPILFFGFWWVPAAPLAYWFLRRLMAHLPTRSSLRAIKEREDEALFFLAALNGSLKAGLPLLSALAGIAALLSSSLKSDIDRIYSLLLFGAHPAQAWSVMKDDPQLASLAKAIPRAQQDGRSLAVVVERVSTLCYEENLKRSRARVKSLSVRLALPVGLCFLPSFLIGGIAPIVYSFFTSLQIF